METFGEPRPGGGGPESPQNRKRKPIAPLRGSALENDSNRESSRANRNRSVIHPHWDIRANEAYSLVPAFFETRGLRPLELPLGCLFS
jgi:hypothetical protein